MSQHVHRDSTTFADPHLESLLLATQSNRRGFLAGASTAGFALAAGPVNAQSLSVLQPTAWTLAI